MSGSTPIIFRVKGAVQLRNIMGFNKGTVRVKEPTAERVPIVGNHLPQSPKLTNIIVVLTSIMISPIAVLHPHSYIIINSTLGRNHL